MSHGVIEQERRRRPRTGERGGPGVAAAAGRHGVGPLFPGVRVVPGDVAHRRQILVGLRREVVPDVAGEGVGRQRTARVGLEQRHRHPQLRRQVVTLEEVWSGDHLGHLGLELRRLGGLPVLVPAREVVRTDAAVGHQRGRHLGHLRRVAAGARLRKHDLAARQHGVVLGQVGRAARSIGEPVRIGRLQEELGHVEGLCFGGLVERRVLARDGDLDRGDRLASDERIEMAQPLFAERADVQIHTIQCADRAH